MGHDNINRCIWMCQEPYRPLITVVYDLNLALTNQNQGFFGIWARIVQSTTCSVKNLSFRFEFRQSFDNYGGKFRTQHFRIRKTLTIVRSEISIDLLVKTNVNNSVVCSFVKLLTMRTVSFDCCRENSVISFRIALF